MQLIRRSALRAAASSPSASFFAKSSRSINTSSPFALRLSVQSRIAPSLFRRFNSDEAPREESAEHERTSAAESATKSTPVSNAIDDAANGFGSSRALDRGGERLAPRILEPNKIVYVGNLLFDITKEDLEREFGQFGTIKTTTIATDGRGLSKGFGYVEFDTISEATAAIEAKHQTIMEGRRLVVNYMAKTNREFKESPPSKTLFIGNLAFEMSDADLNKLFRDIKNVIDVRVAIDRRTGQPRGFAHADFVDVKSAQAAKEVLHEKEVYGRRLRVDFSAGSRKSAGFNSEGGSGGASF